MNTLDSLMEMAKRANGTARTRTLDQKDAETMLSLLESADENTKTVRVYSRDGFVPNSYKYRCDIRYFEATRQDDGQYRVIATLTDAKRSRGNGALVTINGRSA